MLTAIKTTGTGQANHIVLDESLRTDAPSRVSVIVFFENGDDDISEAEWLKAASVNEAFEFLKDDAEDIKDRKPF